MPSHSQSTASGIFHARMCVSPVPVPVCGAVKSKSRKESTAAYHPINHSLHQEERKKERIEQNRKMGWLWSSNSDKTSDGGKIAPDRTSRQRCWESRDLFFNCLDDSNIIDSLKNDKEARRKCGKEIAAFENACSKTWVCVRNSGF